MSSDKPENAPPAKPAPEKPAGAAPPDFGEVPADKKQLAMLCHLLGGLLGVLGAAIMWVIKKDDHPFIDDQGKEATNFQLTLFFGYIAAGFGGIILSCATMGYGAFLMPLLIGAIAVVQLVFGIMGALKAKDGEVYRYPFALRLIK